MAFDPTLNMMQNGMAYCFEELRTNAGQSIQYVRAGSTSEAIIVTAVDKQYRVTDLDGISTWYVSRDYIIHSQLLIVDGGVIVPRRGDLILETINGEAMTYRVSPIDEDRPEWEWSDISGTHYRVHTKRIA